MKNESDSDSDSDIPTRNFRKNNCSNAKPATGKAPQFRYERE